MKRICEFCGKEYNWEEGQLNWTKTGPGKGKGSVNSEKFCCYNCGVQIKLKNMQKTCLDKYGVINYYQSAEVKQKIKNKYGVENPFFSKEIQCKIKDTNLQKYGVVNPSQAPEIKRKKEKTCLKKFGAKTCFQAETCKEKAQKTCLEKYGVDNPAKAKVCQEKAKQTNIEKYGVDYPAQLDSIQEKAQKTCLEKYGVENYSQTKEFKDNFNNIEWVTNLQQKIYITKKKNNTFNISKPEEEIYQLLVQKYCLIKKQYKSEKYPFNCDFYIPQLDLYIEYQGTWTHGTEPYDKDKKEHQEIIKEWKAKAKLKNFKGKKKNYYLNAIHIWSKSDPLKRQVAKENNLNWLEFFNMEEFYDWYKKE